MSVEPFINAWASQYFAKGLGIPSIDSTISDDTILTEYKRNFEEPAKRFMKVNKLSINDAKQFLTELKSNKLYSALYILPALNPVNAETWQVSLRESIKAFTNKYVPYFGIFTKATTCIVCYADEAQGEVLGTYPGIGSLFPLIPLSTKGVNGDAVTYLSRKDPVIMTEQEITATQYLLDCGAVTKDQLNMTLFNLPNGNTQMVTASDLKDIPYSVRKLIKELPFALATEHGGDMYEAARAFAVKAPQKYSEELKWLDTLFRSNSASVAGDSTYNSKVSNGAATELNDDVVKAYLVEKHGMNPDMNISMLFSNPIQYLTGDAVASAIKEEGVDKVLDAMQEDPDYLTGTLDQIIKDYCTEEGVDLRCTIGQLIHYINYDVKIEPPSMAAVIGDYVAQNPNFPTATTVEEILADRPHKYVDDFDTCMEFIDGCSNIDGSVKRALRQALLDNTPLSMPEASVTDEDLCAAIEARNIPEETKLLLTGIIEGTITADELSKPVKGNNRILSAREQAVRDSAGYILNGFRDYLMESDTDAKRLAGQSILYSYLKILYAGRSSIEDDKAFLLKKVDTCTDEGVKKILLEAIDIYTK